MLIIRPHLQRSSVQPLDPIAGKMAIAEPGIWSLEARGPGRINLENGDLMGGDQTQDPNADGADRGAGKDSPSNRPNPPNPPDDQTTVAQLRMIVREFVEQRDWGQFHSPKNLSMSMAIEAAEVMEHFQWLTIDESNAVAGDAQELAAVGEELADVLCYLLGLANQLDLDLSQALRRKMEKNRKKYPVEEFHGRYGHRDRRRRS